MKKIKDIATALLQFEEAANMHADATEHGDYKTANKCYANITKVISLLKEQDDMQKLSELLNHDSIGVRIWAATYLLPVLEDEGLRVLKQIAGSTGIHSLTAKTTVSEWEKGNLKFFVQVNLIGFGILFPV
jgi:hypothetical protein